MGLGQARCDLGVVQVWSSGEDTLYCTQGTICARWTASALLLVSIER